MFSLARSSKNIAITFLLLATQHSWGLGENTQLIGINLSGAGFAPQSLPGVNERNFIFPLEVHFSQWSARGVRMVRFPILWERLQPTLNGPFDPTYAGLIDRTFGYAQKYNVKIILDIHNYMRYRGVVIGTGNVSYSSYKDLITKVALRWNSQPSLYAYDVMNEPHDAITQWPIAAQHAIDGIRSIDSIRPILIEGNGWAEATRWPQWNDSLLGLKDPSNLIVYQAHSYFDGEGGGGVYSNTNADTLPDTYGIERVRPFVEWLRKNGKRGMIGEFGVPDSDPRWNTMMDKMLDYLRSNCVPAFYWAAGPGWGSYNLSIEPVNGNDRPQWTILKKYLAPTNCVGFGVVSIQSSITSSPSFSIVKDLYLSLLERAADPAGLAYWAGLIDQKISSPSDVANQLTQSLEYQTRAMIKKIYIDYLGRAGDPEGITYWTARVLNGSLTIAEVVSNILSSDEYRARLQVKAVYQTYLKRPGDNEGILFWTTLIATKKITISEAIESIKNTQEYKTVTLVDNIYMDNLGRKADDEGAAYWTSLIMGNKMNEQSVVASIRASREFQVRESIKDLYRTLLTREADDQGLMYWTNSVMSGAMSIDTVRSLIIGSAEYQSKH